LSSGRYINLALVILIFAILSVSFKNQKKDCTLVIRFRAMVHGEPLILNKNYRNPFGEEFRISRFRFYAGNIDPLYTNTSIKEDPANKYHLIDFSDSVSTLIEIPVSSGDCNGIRFILGVDSTDQTSGAKSGALDPVRGMFWTWNSGYQSFKIEGSSPASSQPAHLLAYHIGGYRSPNSAVWNIRIHTTADEVFRITPEKKITLELPLELDYFFDGPFPLHIEETPTCTTAGMLARKISENFIGSFTELILHTNP